MSRARRNAISIDMNDEMANAREGIVYLWANITPVTRLATVAAFAKINKLGLAGLGLNSYSSYYYVRDGNLEQSEAFALKDWCSKTVKSLFEKLGFGSDTDGTHGFISNALFSNLVPFVGDIVAGVKGLYDFGKALVKKVELWWKGRHVNLRSGHPQTIAKAIGSLINNQMLEGLFATVKAAVSASLKFISMGVSSVANAVAAVIESIIRLIYMFKQRNHINGFIEECKNYWSLPRSARIASLSGTADHFNELFLEATKNAPIIGGISYATNICGDKFRFLQVLADDGSSISQNQYDAGCRYLDSLKEAGREYSNGWAENLSSNDQVITGLLRIVRKGDQALVSKRPWYKFWGKKQTNKYNYGT